MSPLEPGVSADSKEDHSFVTPPAAATPVMSAKARHPKQLHIKTLKHEVDNTVTYLESSFSYGESTMFYSGRWLFPQSVLVCLMHLLKDRTLSAYA